MKNKNCKDIYINKKYKKELNVYSLAGIGIGGIIGTTSEAIASAVFLKYWFPKVSVVLLAFCVVAVVILINRLGTKYFSYIESGIAALKIFILIAFVVIGITFLLSNGNIL